MPRRLLLLAGLPLPLLLLLLSACSVREPESTSQAPFDTTPQAVQPLAEQSQTGGRPNVTLKQTVQKEPYSVSGNTPGAVRDDINRKRPYSQADSQRFDGNAMWSLTWSFRYDRNGGACALSDATVDLEVLVQLPALSDDSALPDAAMDSWQHFSQDLETHEAGHVQHYLDGAATLQQAFQQTPPAANCDDLGATLRGEGESEIAAIRQADLDYDAATDHGRLQGANFP